MEGIKDFSTKTAKTHTKEEPNSLNPRVEISEFLARLKAKFPQHYAFALTGFVLGQRQSTLRPLRRRGPHADLDLAAKKLCFRRSYTIGESVMETTKSGAEPDVALPDELVDALKEHIARLDAHPIASKSDLLFPSLRTGKMLSSTVLRKPFAKIMSDMKLKRKLTSKAMRRTYQDLADEVQMRAAAAMAVSGHNERPQDDGDEAPLLDRARRRGPCGRRQGHPARHSAQAGGGRGEIMRTIMRSSRSASPVRRPRASNRAGCFENFCRRERFRTSDPYRVKLRPTRFTVFLLVTK